MMPADVGPLVRARRKECGLSQKELARLAGLSRATINYLENDQEFDLSAMRLLAVLRILGIGLVATPTSAQQDAQSVERLLAQLPKADRPSSAVLVEAIVTGRPPVTQVPGLAAFLGRADAQTAVAAVRLAAATGEVLPKQAWRNLRALAAGLEVTAPTWTKG